MADFRSFVTKHARQARRDGLRTALGRAGAQAGLRAASEVRRLLYGPGRRIWTDEWDICIVLDATRWDQWRFVTKSIPWVPPGGSGWSVGSSSPEWYARTFDPAVVPDERVGIVTANPFAAKPADRMDILRHTPLHENPAVDYVDYVFEESWGCEVEGGYLDVTHPATVTDRAWRAWRDWDVDQLVVHYMQPHLPFRSHPEWFGRRGDLDRFGEPGVANDPGPYQGDNKEIWKRVRDGERPLNEVWSAYCDNLDWALEHVRRLQVAVDGRLLVTSDHGNGLGEWGIWSHPPGMQIAALRRVPWVPVRGGAVGELESVCYVDHTASDRSIGVDEQLTALGYVEGGSP